MPEQTLYDVLQVAPIAEPEIITAAHRRLAQMYHPDVNPGPESAERMKQINAAYDVLRDPGRRAKYDALLKRRAAEQAGPVADHAGQAGGPVRAAGPAGPPPAEQGMPVTVEAPLGDLDGSPGRAWYLNPGFWGAIVFVVGLLGLMVMLLPSEQRSGSAAATATPRVAAAPIMAATPSARVAAATPVPPTASPVGTVAPTAAPPAVSATAAATVAPPPAPASAPAPGAAAGCESAPDSQEQGEEFDVVSADAVTAGRELSRAGPLDTLAPSLRELVVVAGQIRNNCDAGSSAAVSYTLLGEDGQPIAASDEPLLLENVEPRQVREFRFPPVRASGATGLVVKVEKR